MATYTSKYKGSQIDNGVAVGLNVIQIQCYMARYGYETSETTNPEFEFLIIDSENKILAGKRIDGSVLVSDL